MRHSVRVLALRQRRQHRRDRSARGSQGWQRCDREGVHQATAAVIQTGATAMDGLFAATISGGSKDVWSGSSSGKRPIPAVRGPDARPRLDVSADQGLFVMVGDTGIEPVTSSVSGKRSPAELIALHHSDGSFRERSKLRGGNGIRTRVHGFAGRCLASRPSHRGGNPGDGLDLFRADDGIRTRDPHLGKVMRYQLRYVRLCLTSQRGCAARQLYLKRLVQSNRL